MLRILNSLLTLPLICLFWIHSIPQSLFLLGYLPFSPDRKLWAYLFAALLLLHGLISLALALQKYRRPHRIYPAQNKGFLLQITMGILILVLFALHAVSFGYTTSAGEYILRDPQITILLLQITLTIAAGLHCLISIPKACVTLGLLTREQHMTCARIAAAAGTRPPVALSLIAFTGYYLPAITGGIW